MSAREKVICGRPWSHCRAMIGIEGPQADLLHLEDLFFIFLPARRQKSHSLCDLVGHRRCDTRPREADELHAPPAISSHCRDHRHYFSKG